jgi:2-polyprenyl-6-methoxyphenol hydroxylase-like FAD-dependent oxidoreductase
VAGAGIGGLAAGIALRRSGFEVTLLERSSAPREVGSGILIQPNRVRALEALGIRTLPGSALQGLELRS